jgi:acetyl esterase/lipase
LATHYPDRFKAVVSASGWFRREYYGDSNPIFNHDVQLGFQDLETKVNSQVSSQYELIPGGQSILERSIAEHDCTQSARNLQDLGVYIRHGGSDRTVPVWMGRRYSRVLAQLGVFAAYQELPEMDHWWWDTAVPNDGGVMFDTTLRAFINSHFDLPTSIADRFTVTSLNPATFGPKHGVQVLKLRAAGK